jgi:hypothetical protein
MTMHAKRVRARVLARGEAQDAMLSDLPQGERLAQSGRQRAPNRSRPPEGAIVTAWLAKGFGLHPVDPRLIRASPEVWVARVMLVGSP